MKNTIITLFIIAVMFSACTNNQPNETQQSQTHQHDDGSVHADHAKDSVVQQQEFNATADTSINTSEPAPEHSHDGHEHPHSH